MTINSMPLGSLITAVFWVQLYISLLYLLLAWLLCSPWVAIYKNHLEPFLANKLVDPFKEHPKESGLPLPIDQVWHIACYLWGQPRRCLRSAHWFGTWFCWIIFKISQDLTWPFSYDEWTDAFRGSYTRYELLSEITTERWIYNGPK